MTRFVLADNAATEYRILIGSTAPEAVLTIAKQLQRYLYKMSGARLSIVRDSRAPIDTELCVGPTRRARFSFTGRNCEEFYRIHADGQRLHLLGGGVRGTMYAVNSFLELLGVRFFTPVCEHVPSCTTLCYEHARDIYFKPIVEFRDTNWTMTRDPAFCEKLKINSKQSRELPIAGGKGYFGWFVHTMGALAEMEPPFMNKQPCLTDEAVFQTVLKNVRKRFEDYPGNNIISVSQNDGTKTEPICKCERCREINEREGTYMGTTLYMANRIADAIRDERPDVLVDTLSYNFTCVAPKYMMPLDNVVIRFVTAFCCIHHALEDAKNSPGAGSERKSIEFNENLARWQEMAKTLYMWYYTTSYSNYMTPLPNFEAFRRDMSYLTKNRVRGFFLQGNNCTCGEFEELRAYLAAKLLWEPQMPKKEYYRHMDEFLAGYYGPAAPFVRAYIDLVMKTEPDTHFHLYADPMQIYPPRYKTVGGREVLDLTFVEKGKAIWQQAADAVRGMRTFSRRVEKSSMQHLYYEISLRHATLDSADDPKRALAVLYRLNRRLYALMKKYSVAFVAEGNKGLRDGQTPHLENHPLQWYSVN